jgi:hypothetical protein
MGMDEKQVSHCYATASRHTQEKQSVLRLYRERCRGNSVSCHHELAVNQLPSSDDAITEAEKPPWLAAIT